MLLRYNRKSTRSACGNRSPIPFKINHLTKEEEGRVAMGGYPPMAPTDPDVLTLEHPVPQVTPSLRRRHDAAANPSLAIRWRFGDTKREFNASQVFLTNGVVTRCLASHPPGPCGSSSPASSVISRHYDFLSRVPPCFVAFLAVPRSHSLDFAPRRASAPPRPGVDHPVSPAGNLRGDDRISQVPGESPLSVCTCSCRRRQDCSHQTITVPQRGPWTPRCKGSHERSFDAQ